MTPAIELSGVSKRFAAGFSLCRPWRRNQVQALDRVTLRIERGSIFALLGPNGSGKTTLLKILSTVLAPDGGEARIHGLSCAQEPERVRRLASLALGQDQGFYGRLTARENLRFFGALYEVPAQESRRRIEDAGRRLGLAEALDRPYAQLSSGIRQRLHLARSFLQDAPVLLADEPTRGLDPVAKGELHRLLLDLARNLGKTILLTTHDLWEAQALADSIGILEGGVLRWSGPPAKLRASGTRLGEAFSNLRAGEAVS